MRPTIKDYCMARVAAFIIGVVALGCSTVDVHALNASASYTMKNERVRISIEGMHCTSCAHGIKAMLKRTPGVISAEVSFEQREATVEYDAERTTPAKIVEAINNLGYKAKVKEEKET
jgi:copper chaperone CopZ